MAYYIYVRAKQASKGWELLEKIEGAELAEKAYVNYRQVLGETNTDNVAIIEARNLLEGLDLLNAPTMRGVQLPPLES